MTWDATYETSLWLTWFLDIHFGVDMRRDMTTLRIFFLIWVKEDHWLMTRWSISFIAQFSKQCFVYVGDIFQHIHKMYVILVLMVSMLTSNNNNMRIRPVQFLEFFTITPPFIQPNHEISSKLNLSRVYCLLDQESCVTSIKLKNSVNVCLSLCIFDDLV